MSLIRISNRLFNQPWLIKPEMLKNMQSQFEAYSKKASVLDDEDDDTEEVIAPQAQTGPVRVINVDGTLGLHLSLLESMCGGVDYNSIRSQLKEYKEDPTCTAIVMLINSPGGMVGGCKETADIIADVAAVKPVYAYTDGMCCSAAYWLASQASYIFCSESSEIGSIGCIMTHADYSRQLDKEGITVTSIKSNEFKDIGSPHRPMTEEEYNILKQSVIDIENQFIATILSKRSIDKEVLNGLTHDGNKAVMLGFADGIVTDVDDLIASISTPNLTN